MSVLLQQLSAELNSVLAAPQGGAMATQGTNPPNPFGLFPEQHETDRIAGSFSTWFEYWGGVIGAAHSVEAWPNDRKQWPDWTKV